MFLPENAVSREYGGGGNRTRERWRADVAGEQGKPVTTPWRPAGVDVWAACQDKLYRWTNLYVVREVASGRVKIGLAVDPGDRLKTLQLGNPDTLEIVVTLPVAAAAERVLHEALADHSVRGEWFADCAPVRATIDELLELSYLVADYSDLFAEDGDSPMGGEEFMSILAGFSDVVGADVDESAAA